MGKKRGYYLQDLEIAQRTWGPHSKVKRRERARVRLSERALLAGGFLFFLELGVVLGFPLTLYW